MSFQLSRHTAVRLKNLLTKVGKLGQGGVEGQGTDRYQAFVKITGSELSSSYYPAVITEFDTTTLDWTDFEEEVRVYPANDTDAFAVDGRYLATSYGIVDDVLVFVSGDGVCGEGFASFQAITEISSEGCGLLYTLKTYQVQPNGACLSIVETESEDRVVDLIDCCDCESCGWGGIGWYCCGDYCDYYETCEDLHAVQVGERCKVPPCSEVICLGPYATEEECLSSCDSDSGSPCCESEPTTIHMSIIGTGTCDSPMTTPVVLTRLAPGFWQSDNLYFACSESNAWTLTCVDGTWTVSLEHNLGYLTDISFVSASCSPFSVHFTAHYDCPPCTRDITLIFTE